MENTKKHMFNAMHVTLNDVIEKCKELGPLFEERIKQLEECLEMLPSFEEAAMVRVRTEEIKLDSIIDGKNHLTKGGDHVRIVVNGQPLFHGPIQGINDCLVVSN